jgi:hypothetical protein
MPLCHEADELIQWRRLRLCRAKIDLLEKLADPQPTRANIIAEAMPGIYFDDRWVHLMWRRQKDYKVVSDA